MLCAMPAIFANQLKAPESISLFGSATKPSLGEVMEISIEGALVPTAIRQRSDDIRVSERAAALRKQLQDSDAWSRRA